MEDEEKINKEIQNFLAKTTRPGAECVGGAGAAPKRTGAGELVEMLSRLQKTYSKIQEALEAKDEEGVKSEILRSDVKMSLVCESLVRVLRETYTERNEFAETIERLEARETAMAEEKKRLEESVIKLENEVKYAAQASGELERFVKDQRQGLEAARSKFDAQRKALENMKLVNEEMDASRKLLIEKCEVSGIEIETLKGHIEDRARIIEDLKEKLRSMERLNEGLQTANRGLLAKSEALSKKLEIKEKSLDVVNSELAKLLRQRGAKPGDVDMHASAVEGGNFVGNESAHNEDTVLKYQKVREKYRKTRRKLLRKVRSYEEQRKANEQDILEIDKLQKSVKNLKSERALESENNKQLVECLIKKIESLIEQNHRTQDELYRIKMRDLEREKLPNLSFKSCAGEDGGDGGYGRFLEKKEPAASLDIGLHGNANAGGVAAENAYGASLGNKDREYLRGRGLVESEEVYCHAGNKGAVAGDLTHAPPPVDVREAVPYRFDIKNQDENAIEEANANERQRYYSFVDDEVWKTMEEHNKEEASADEYRSLYDAYNDFVQAPRSTHTYGRDYVAGEQPVHGARRPEEGLGIDEGTGALRQESVHAVHGQPPPVGAPGKDAAEHNQFTFLDETGGWGKEQYGEQYMHDRAPEEDENNNADRLSEASVQTVKTASTTQTLRDMLRRTEKLKGKFSDLENELMNIKKINAEPEVPAKANLGYFYPETPLAAVGSSCGLSVQPASQLVGTAATACLFK
ncbi:UNVERIFIED_CONTAM: hypothetical protein PYX00_011833 [Menopon gallinae]|uniref:Uncharacterized protein n=1 Tax=Menopon gallinae TaxID=328185 RepID=A0AAW2H8J9_9NEOP